MDIPDSVLKRLLSVFHRTPAIHQVFLYGSRARGDHRPNSDIDLALHGANIPSSVSLDIQEAAGLYKVDVIHLDDELAASFLDELEKDAVLIFERESSASLQKVR